MKVKKLLIMLCVLALSASMLFAMGGSEAKSPAASSSSSGEKGIKDTLVIGVAQEINSQNPMMQNDQINNNCFALTHERLIEVIPEEGYKVAPEIAKSWEWTDDTHLVFELYDNITFSDGTPLTADDVVFTINRARSNDVNVSKISGTLGLIADVKALGPYTVEVTTTSFTNEIIYNFASYPLSIMCKKAYEDPNNKEPWLIGSGPYVFEEWKEGQYCSYVKRADYWNPEKAGVSPRIEFRFLLEASQRAIALQNGEIDVCIDPQTTDLQFLAKDPNVTVHTQDGTRLFYMGFNVAKAPLDNVKLRQAISCAIDKEAIVDIVLEGRGKSQTTVLNRGAWSFMDDDRFPNGYKYDVERAKKLLAEAGYKPGELTLELTAATSDPYKTIAPIIQANLREIGIAVNIKSMDQATLKTECAAGHQQMFLWRWNIGARVDETFRELYYTNFPTNYHHLADENVDRLADAVLTTKDPAQRLAYSEEIQNYLVEIVPQVPLYVPDLVIAFNSNIKGLQLYGGGNHDWSHAYVEK